MSYNNSDESHRVKAEKGDLSMQIKILLNNYKMFLHDNSVLIFWYTYDNSSDFSTRTQR